MDFSLDKKWVLVVCGITLVIAIAVGLLFKKIVWTFFRAIFGYMPIPQGGGNDAERQRLLAKVKAKAKAKAKAGKPKRE